VPMVLENMGFFQYRWGSDGAGHTSHISWMAGLHPFLALRVLFGEPAYRPPEAGMLQHLGWLRAWYLGSPHTFYVSSMFLLSFVLVMPSIVMLRHLAQSSYTLRGRLLQVLRLSSGDKTRKPRRVWTNPIAWREARTKASASRAVLLRYGFMITGIAAAIVLIVMSSTHKPPDRSIGLAYRGDDRTITILDQGEAMVYLVAQGANVQFNGEPASPDSLRVGLAVDFIGIDNAAERRTLNRIQVSRPQTLLPQATARQFLLGAIMVELAVILLILTQSAASTVTREKEDGTLDLLLSTPITSRYYIWGKLYGLVTFVLPLVAVPVVSIMLFVAWDIVRPSPWLTGGQRWMVYPEAILILPVTLVMVTAFAAILGMQMSLRCRKTVMAVMASVGIVGGICGVLWMCGTSAASSDNFSGLGLIIGSFSPFTLMSLLVSPFDVAGSNWGRHDTEILQSRLLVFITGWAAAAVYAFVVWAMYKSMVHNFDMTIRKQAL
jgi:ABC-type transport system involved in multi-copper enzyme maturation permease subunit